MKKPLYIFMFICFLSLFSFHKSLASVSGHGCHAAHGHSGGHSSFSGAHGYGYHDHAHNKFVCELPLKGVTEFNGSIGTTGIPPVKQASIKMSTPNLFADYKYYITNGLALDIAVGTQALQGRDTCKCSLPNEELRLYDYKLTTARVMAGISWIYYSHNMFQLYGSVMVGVTYLKENDVYDDHAVSSLEELRVNMNITAFGVRYGRALGAFVELNAGGKGLIAGGLSYQGGWKRY